MALFTEAEILEQLDETAMQFEPSAPKSQRNLQYEFILDLEHGYCETAGSRIHLFADSARWAIVMEKCGYMNRGGRAEIELDYFGNCVDYPEGTEYGNDARRSNVTYIELISGEEYERITAQPDDEHTFEKISPDAGEVTVHGQLVPLNHDADAYAALGIDLEQDDDSRPLIGFSDLVRYLSDTQPALVQATDEEVRQHLPADLPEILVLDQFHFHSAYGDQLPGSTELYQLIAKVLVARDADLWKPTLPPNNHWSNWESGNL